MPRKKKAESKRCERLRLDGTPCKAWAVQGTDFCRKHQTDVKKSQNLATQKALASVGLLKQTKQTKDPTAKAGYRYSGALPKNSVPRYEGAVKDPNLLGLRDEVALLQMRIYELQEEIQRNESRAAWFKAYEHFQLFEEALKAQDSVQMSENLTILRRTLKHGVDKRHAWDEVRQTISLLKAVGESERKRMLELQQYMTIESALTMVSALVTEIRKHITAQDVLEAISSGISDLLNARKGFYRQYTDYLERSQKETEEFFGYKRVPTDDGSIALVKADEG